MGLLFTTDYYGLPIISRSYKNKSSTFSKACTKQSQQDSGTA